MAGAKRNRTVAWMSEVKWQKANQKAAHCAIRRFECLARMSWPGESRHV